MFSLISHIVLKTSTTFVTPYQDCSSRDELSKTLLPGLGLIVPIYLYRKLKNLLVRNRSFLLGTLYQDCPSGYDWSEKHGHQGRRGRWGLGQDFIFPIYLYENNNNNNNNN